MTPTHVKLLYMLNALFFCALAGVLWYQLQAPGQPLQGSGPSGAAQQVDAQLAEQMAKVTVGDNADNPAAKRLGTIAQINGDSFALKEQPSGVQYAVSMSNATKVEIMGAPKDPAAYQKELDEYYARVKLLVQDPLANKDALAALTLPRTNEFKQGSIADLAVGDSVVAVADAPISGGSFVAIKIIKTLPQAR